MSDFIGAIYISEGLRSTLSMVLLIGNFLSINFACVCMILSWYVKASLDKQATFLKDFYQPAAVPVSLLLSGIIMLAASLLGIKSAIGGRFDEDDLATSDVKSVATFFLAYWVLALVLCVLLCITMIVCFVEIYELEAALGKGLKSAMTKYRTDGELKTEIDYLQMDYQCCGVENFKDWFNISWVDLQYLDLRGKVIKQRIKDGYYYGDDVPFSCCKMKLTRPCVDTRIMVNTYHSNYNYQKDITLNTVGCREAMIRFLGHVIFKSMGSFMLTCVIVWVLLAISARYLHTSTSSLSKGQPSYGWLIGVSMAKKKEQPKEEGEANDELLKEKETLSDT